MTSLRSTEPPPIVSVLSVSLFPEDQAALNAIFQHSRWRLFHTGSWTEANTFLAGRSVPIVISEADPDHTWQDSLTRWGALPSVPRLIVTSHFADDRLWAEALNLGAHDVLSEPFDAREVLRTVGLAWRQWCEESGRIDGRDGSRCLAAAS